jgi:PAS domain S-box-containing protein
MEGLTGCTRDELIGAPFKNYFTDPEQAQSAIKLVLIKTKVTNYELTACNRNGNQTVVSFNATTFYDRNRRLQGVFAAARDITERKHAEKQILELALHDTLTQLPNRHLLNERLVQSMTASQRSGSYSALMFMDLDNFKAHGPFRVHQARSPGGRKNPRSAGRTLRTQVQERPPDRSNGFAPLHRQHRCAGVCEP